MSAVPVETELKFACPDPGASGARLAAAGAVFEGARLEADTYYDDAAGSFEAGDRVLRLRLSAAVEPSRLLAEAAPGRPAGVTAGPGAAGRRWWEETPRGDGAGGVITYKGPRRPDGRYKTRLELEVTVGDARAAGAVLEALGFRPRARVEKGRLVYRLGEALVTLDRLPFLGWYVEVEAPGPQLEAACRALGLDPAGGSTANYLELFAEHRRRWGRPAAAVPLTFAAEAGQANRGTS